MTARRRLSLLLLSLAMVAGCGSSSAKTVDPETLLARAKATLDQTAGLHFTLTSKDVPAGGTRLLGGEGVAVRPDGFQGKLQVSRSGLTVPVQIVSLGGKVYAQLPFSSSYAVVDPATFGFADPGRMLRTDGGLSSLLTATTKATLAGRKRVSGTVVQTVDVTLPGSVVASLLTSADPSRDVTGTVFIEPDSNRLRKAVLTGPFFAKDQDSTFTIELDRYGDHPTIRAPN